MKCLACKSKHVSIQYKGCQDAVYCSESCARIDWRQKQIGLKSDDNLVGLVTSDGKQLFCTLDIAMQIGLISNVIDLFGNDDFIPIEVSAETCSAILNFLQGKPISFENTFDELYRASRFLDITKLLYTLISLIPERLAPFIGLLSEKEQYVKFQAECFKYQDDLSDTLFFLKSQDDLEHYVGALNELDVSKFPYLEKVLEHLYSMNWYPDYGIHSAAVLRRFDVVNWFIDAGISQNVKNSALIDAAEGGAVNIVDLLIKNGAAIEPYAIIRAAANGHLTMVNRLIELGADPKVERNQALIIAAQNSHLSVVNRLLEVGADPKDQNNQSLILASAFGSYEVVDRLLRAGADPKARESEALVLAVKSPTNRFEIIKRLLEAGADVAAQHNTPLFYAVHDKKLDIARLLIEKGAPRNRF